MKKLVLLGITLFCLNTLLMASHLMGGEITWTCTGNGAFVFTVKLYRDCNGIAAPNSVSLSTNAPVGSILCPMISSQEISPIGLGCPTCAAPNGALAAAQEFIYQSSPVNLVGVPPPSGWYFFYDDCCRNAAISNLQLPGGQSFVLHATMYPFNGQNAFPCFDQSPQFHTIPSLGLCNRDTVNYSHAAYDPELDSLRYTWAPPLSTYPSGFSTFAAGYSYTQPLPGPAQNPANVAATLDSSSGMLSFYNVTNGAFVTKTRIESFKCGQLVAEVFREVQIGMGSCFIDSINLNHAPVYTPSQSVVWYSIVAGDSIEQTFLISDFELLPPALGSIAQTITLNALSPHFGLNYSDTVNGCLIPPCATLQNPTPQLSPVQLSNTLKWKTACAHAGFFNGCLQHVRRFEFVFKANDDFCPLNGVRNKIYQIDVSGPVVYEVGNSLAVSYPGVSIQWHLNGVPIPGATDTIFTPTQSGIYTIVATTPTGCQMVSNPCLRVFSGLDGVDKNKNISVYPNPGNAGLMINLQLHGLNTGPALVRMIDLQGRQLRAFELNITNPNEMLVLDPNGLPGGVYTIEVRSGNDILQERLVLNP
jgi:hypothetical protein